MTAVVPRKHVGKLEQQFYDRCARELKRPPKGCRYDAEKAEFPIKWIEKYCRHHKGEWAGKPLILEHWQKEVLRHAFGWLKQNENGEWVRRFRTMYIEVGRKNGKSEIAGALALFMLVADGEEGAEVYSSATKKDQAKIVFKTASAMVKRSPALKKAVKLFTHAITVGDSTLQPLSSESNTLDGLNPHGNIVDELHAHRDRGVWDVLASALGSRRQPMTIAITTAGVYDPTGIGWEMHDYATKVLDQTFDDDEFLAFVSTVDEGDDNFGDVALQKANPNWGVSAYPSFLRKQAEKAQRQPGFLNEYLTKHLNSWTQQAKRWLPMDRWAACEPDLPPAHELIKLRDARELALKGLECRGGLDLSSKLDLTSLVLEFERPGGVLELVCRFWIPEARVKEQLEKGQRHYDVWQREGWLSVTPGDVIDYEFIRAEVNELAEKMYVVKELAYDPWGATDLATRLMGDGRVMVECHQGFKTFSEPSKDVEARIVKGAVRHGGNPVMKWCCANAVVATDPAGNIKPDKAKATGKIDGLVAWVMARSRGIVNKPQEAHSTLLDQGGIVLG